MPESPRPESLRPQTLKAQSLKPASPRPEAPRLEPGRPDPSRSGQGRGAATRTAPRPTVATLRGPAHAVSPARARAEAAPNIPAVEPGRLGNMLGFQLRLAHAASFRAFSQRIGPEDGNPAWFSVLALIEANPGLGQTELSRAAGRDKSTLTATLSALMQDGLVVRRQDDQDRRRYALALTPEGQKALERMAAHAAAHEAELDRIVKPADRKRVMDALRRLHEALA